MFTLNTRCSYLTAPEKKRLRIAYSWIDSALAAGGGGADSTIYQTKFRSDTARVNIYSAIAGVPNYWTLSSNNITNNNSGNVNVTVTSSGSLLYAFNSTLNSGYTGSGLTWAGRFINNAAGTGKSLNTPAGDVGATLAATGVSNGYKYGGRLIAGGGYHSIGGFSDASTANIFGHYNVGHYARATNGHDITVAMLATGGVRDTVPELKKSSIYYGDNLEDSTYALLTLARQGVIKLSVDSMGGIVYTGSTPVNGYVLKTDAVGRATWQPSASSNLDSLAKLTWTKQGDTVDATISNAAGNIWYRSNPYVTKTSQTVTMPPNPFDGQKIKFNFGGAGRISATGTTVIGTFTVAPNAGQTIIGQTVFFSRDPNDSFIWTYDISNTSWYR